MTEDRYPIPGLPVWQNPERMSGALCFAGTRLPVSSLFKNLKGGVSLDEYLDAFEGVTWKQVVAVLNSGRKSVLDSAQLASAA